jgi:hypothetical protein
VIEPHLPLSRDDRQGLQRESGGEMQRSLGLILVALALFLRPGHGGAGASHFATNGLLALASIAAHPTGVWRDDYAAGNGAPPLHYRPSSTNCTLNSGAGDNGSQVPAAGGGCWLAVFPPSGIDIREFGADSTGTKDSAPPIGAAAIAAGSGTVVIPAGTFKGNSQISVAVPAGGFTLQGKGSGISVLNFPSTNAFLFTLGTGSRAPPLHLRDFSLLTGGTGTSVGITVTQTIAFGTNDNSDISNVTLRGDDGGQATRYWSTGIILNFASFFNFYGLDIIGSSRNLGTGISLTSNATTPGIVYNFTLANFQNLSTGILVASTWVQGITVAQSNFTNGVNGVSIPSGGGIGEIQLALVGNQFGYLTNAAVDSEVAFADIMFHDNLVIAPSGASGVIIGNATRVSIENNHFVALGAGTGKGVDIKSTGSTGNGGIVSGNILNGFATGINLQAGASGFTVTRNVNQSNTTFVTNVGTRNIIDGDTVSSTVLIGGEVTLSTGVAANVTSISVPPGNWLIRGDIIFDTASISVVSSIGAAVSTVSATLDSGMLFPSSGTGFSAKLSTGAFYFSFQSATTVYLVAYSAFTTATQKAYGSMTAVRQLQ